MNSLTIGPKLKKFNVIVNMSLPSMYEVSAIDEEGAKLAAFKRFIDDDDVEDTFCEIEASEVTEEVMGEDRHEEQ